MKTILSFSAVLIFATVGSLLAHHSLGNFDPTPLHLKGSIVSFELVNPHSLIYLDQKKANGTVQRWSVVGPSLPQLDRMGVGKDTFRVGDVIEMCGFALKEGVQQTGKSTEGTVFSGHLVVMPDGKRRFWSDYGLISKCLEPGETRESVAW